MKKNVFTREVRVGIMVISSILLLYFGLNFLKGIDVFSSVDYYYAQYENIGGLVPSCPVNIKGYKVGQVEEITYDFSKKQSFMVKISVSSKIKVPKGAVIELYDDGLMGGKAMQLVYAPSYSAQQMFTSGDTIPSGVSNGMMEQVAGALVPKIESVSLQADSLLRSVRLLLENKDLHKSLHSIEHTTANLAESSKQLKGLMSKDVPHIVNNVNTITSDFKQVSGNLKKIDFVGTVDGINQTVANLNLITSKMKGDNGTMGLLLNDKSLYLNLSSAAASSDKLLIDMRENPKRYVHFSLFGSKQK